MATAQSDWRTANSIVDDNDQGYYPAACCCARYHTDGTKAFVDCTTQELYNGTGFWYLPSAGEWGYVAARFADINECLTLLQSSYSSGIPLWDSNYSTSLTAYLLSTPCDAEYMLWSGFNLDANSNLHSFDVAAKDFWNCFGLVRAFCQL